MTLDTALADLINKASLTADQVAPEVIKLMGARIHTNVGIASAALLVCLAAFLWGWRRHKHDEYGEMGPVFMISGAIVGVITAIFFACSIADLVAFTSSPVGFVTMHLLGK